MIPAVLEAKLTATPMDWEDYYLRARCQGTVWEPQRLQNFPGLLSAAQVVVEMRAHFSGFELDQGLWQQVQDRLQACDIVLIQQYTAWQRLRGGSWDLLGPQPLLGRDRASILASFGRQRFAGDTAKGLDHLLPPGLGPEEHLAQARQLPSPFRFRSWPEEDVTFVLEAILVWRQFLPAFASKLRHVVKTLVTAVAPLNQALYSYRNEASKRVAGTKNPAFVSLCTAVLRWPDTLQPVHLVQGYPIVGELEPTGIFRPIASTGEIDVVPWLGEQAVQAVDQIVTSRPPLHHPDILATTKDEMAKGFCSELRTRQWFDKHYGAGSWRPLERFIIQQADGKKRVIDNCKRTEHNRYTAMSETIYTINVDFVAAVLQMLLHRLDVQDLTDLERFSWLAPRLGTEDLPDAYRGLPVETAHLPYSVVAIYDAATGWRFSQLWGLAFGLESAVVSFNRFPALGVAATRRMVLGMCACYFDDQLALELVQTADVSRQGLLLIFSSFGAPPQPTKSFRPSANRHFLGTSVHVGDVPDRGVMRFQPKSTTRAKVEMQLQTCLQSRRLDADTAGKMRGDLNWMFSQCAGFAGKLAGPLLAEKQRGGCPDLRDDEILTLRVLLAVVKSVEPRDIQLLQPAHPPTLIYSDASFEKNELRLGWVVMVPGARPFGGTCLVPSAVLATWQPRTQQIFPGESLCALLIPHLHGSSLQGKDIVWFVDNSAAVAALVRTTCTQTDVHGISQYAHFLLCRHQCRTWFEWIDSRSNIADGLSRDGLADEWTLQQNWAVMEYSYPISLSSQGFLDVLADVLPF